MRKLNGFQTVQVIVKNCSEIFCIISFCIISFYILAALIYLLGIVLYSSAEVAFVYMLWICQNDLHSLKPR